jgi:hypothetical chaperone protein
VGLIPGYHCAPMKLPSLHTPARACGIDFGTSNSTVGWSRGAAPLLLPLEDGKPTLPSGLFFHAEDGHVSYGRSAMADYLEGYEGRLMRSLKSLLGSSMMDGHTEVAGRALPFRDLLALFVGELKRRAEQVAGREFTQAVLGRPVFFVDGDAAADQLAQATLQDVAQRAGLREVVFQYEPIAAAFDYESQIDREELVLVVDIGGGTSDFALIQLGPQRVAKRERRDDILASGGVHLGGTDFDRAQPAQCDALAGPGRPAQKRAGDPLGPVLQPGHLAHHQPGLQSSGAGRCQ